MFSPVVAFRSPIVERRLRSFAYLKEIYDGSERHWLSVVSFGAAGPKEEGVAEEPHAVRWYYLGLSLATLMAQPPGIPFLRAVLQTLEEHQHHFSSSFASSRGMRARANHHRADDESLTPALHRVNGKVMYEYLLTPHVAHALSGVQLALGLCDLLSNLYRKLAECPSAIAVASAPAITDAIHKIDERLEEVFLSPAARHTEGLSKAAMRQSLNRLDPLFARLWSGQTAGGAGAADFGIDESGGL